MKDGKVQATCLC